MQTEELSRFLEGVDLFATMTIDELQLLAEKGETVDIEAGSTLFEENTPRNSLWIIYDGEVELYKHTPYGEERRLSFFGVGDFLGEGALLDDYPHSTSAKAVVKTTAFRIDRDSFQEIVMQSPAVGTKLLSGIGRVISRRMRQASARVVDAAAQYVSGRTRREHDLLGERDVPYEYYYGIQTLRAVENFSITGIPLSHFPVLISSLSMVKMGAAKANHDLGLLSEEICNAICEACRAIINGKYHTHFVVDMIQGGAGTSTNMNANEVIANRALEILGYEKGQYKYCHPNNHVNLSQSTNDAYPTALKIALIYANRSLIRVLDELAESFRKKGDEFASVLKMGRTQLQDAVPMTLGQEFHAYATTLAEEIDRLNDNVNLFLSINMGGTAIGTGINAHPEYPRKVLMHLREITGLDLRLAEDLVEETQDTGAFVMYSSAIKRLAVKLSKICNDLRLLSSGPRAGLNEINLPPVQPGSSIMPGKVNPVIPEVVNQIAFKVIGNDLSVTLAAEAGQLELNVFEPIILESLFESLEILENGMKTLKHRCVDGITANADHCRRQVKKSIGLVTALVPVLGYDVCSALAKEALESGRGLYELVLERSLLSREELDELLAPENMISNHHRQ